MKDLAVCIKNLSEICVGKSLDFQILYRSALDDYEVRVNMSKTKVFTTHNPDLCEAIVKILQHISIGPFQGAT